MESMLKHAWGPTDLWHALLGDICSHSHLADGAPFLDCVPNLWLAQPPAQLHHGIPTGTPHKCPCTCGFRKATHALGCQEKCML